MKTQSLCLLIIKCLCQDSSDCQLHSVEPLYMAYRVHTMAVPVVQDLREMYMRADGGAIACVLGKLAVEHSYSARLEETRKQACMRCMRHTFWLIVLPKITSVHRIS